MSLLVYAMALISVGSVGVYGCRNSGHAGMELGWIVNYVALHGPDFRGETGRGFRRLVRDFLDSERSLKIRSDPV